MRRFLSYACTAALLPLSSAQVSCDTSQTSGDTNWRNAMHSELVDDSSAVSRMIAGMCSLSHPFWDCNANGNSKTHCKYTVSTLSYNATYEMWSDKASYPSCDSAAKLINGFCTTSRPPQQGSGYFRSPSDNYNFQVVANAPFITCSGDNAPSDNQAPALSALLEGLCGSDSCQYDEDKPECDREVRHSNDYFVRMKAQNYGSGGTPHCQAAAGELIQRCYQDKKKRGGNWAIGGFVSGSQEYVELGWTYKKFQEYDDVDEGYTS
ncbi:hypothetical protein K469DRAFT_752985 [Zopfia rhizophila CBS 207.26]|uniref:Ecp2 effector protein domain-containing protein n=1 Tax=Zopfia rhizophila CBS 207.26 TaxID=1314779 RepID=A0A6A6DSG4_9PEZI|nr:hypothetical protein K469DRAFT_752985 [Zopfia rhizophila CBS 207.26]